MRCDQLLAKNPKLAREFAKKTTALTGKAAPTKPKP